MAYSTSDQLENNVKLLAKTYENAGDLAERVSTAITEADDEVNDDIGNIIDIDLIPAIDASPPPITPKYINRLSQYKAAEIALVQMQGARRQKEAAETDITYWQGRYNKLLNKIMGGEIALELSDGTNIGTGVTTFDNSALPDVDPRPGYGKYGQWKDKDDLEDQRQTETGGYPGS